MGNLKLSHLLRPHCLFRRSGELLASLSLLITTSILLMYHTPAYGVASICDATIGNLVANCGFESSNTNGWTVYNPDAPALNLIVLIDGNISSSNSGDYFLAAGPVHGSGTVSQTINTVAGQLYSLSFYLSQGGGMDNSFSVTWDVNGANQVILLPLVNSPIFAYTKYDFLVTASSASTNLQFTFFNPPWFWLFDDVSLVAVPEPSTWMILGTLLGAGVLIKGRRVAKEHKLI